jgi:hypothetical protein
MWFAKQGIPSMQPWSARPSAPRPRRSSGRCEWRPDYLWRMRVAALKRQLRCAPRFLRPTIRSVWAAAESMRLMQEASAVFQCAVIAGAGEAFRQADA